MSTLSVNNIESVVNLTVANTITIGNSTVNTTISTSGSGVLSANSLVATTLSVGNSTVNTTANSTAISIGSEVTVNTTAISIGSEVTVNTTAISIGNSTVNSFINSSSISFGNSAANVILSSSQLSIPSGIIIAQDFQQSVAQFSWNSATTTPAAVYSDEPIILTNAHKNMRRCLLLDNGTVNYYLDPYDSTKKADGTAATLTGADGMVMVEIPKFYTKRQVSGTVTTWFLSDYPLTGYTVHPAFQKNGVEVNYRYIGVYDACYFDATDSLYKSGFNRDDSTSILDIANDKLVSVSGFGGPFPLFPLVGATRAECRALAANRGTGWRQVDFWLISAIQYLYLTEYRSFYTQNILGDGNTGASYLPSSILQSDSPHSEAGKSHFLGNRSTNAVTGASSATRNTAYMSYRGIENWYGNCWTWVDGVNINDRQAYVSNTDSTFDDSSLTTNDYSALGTTMPTSDNYVTNGQAIDNAWLPASVGGSSSTYWTDYYYQTTGLQAAVFGGRADNGAGAGGFYWALDAGASFSSRGVGARLAF